MFNKKIVICLILARGGSKGIPRKNVKKIGNKPLMLKINMESGHSGSSARHEKYKEIAFEYAFLLRVVGH